MTGYKLVHRIHRILAATEHNSDKRQEYFRDQRILVGAENTTEGRGELGLSTDYMFYLLSERVLANVVDPLLTDLLGVGREVGTLQTFLPAAAGVPDGRPLLDRPSVAPLSLQVPEAQGYVPRRQVVMLVDVRDSPLPCGRPIKRPQEHISIDLLVYEEVY